MISCDLVIESEAEAKSEYWWSREFPLEEAEE
jgi:hypothetical protein